ncbi:hypothetical protein [Runella aurantiaca]|uniref:Uncharacterized protein n=1 Tax=Runella aurantiaca TaxID=2282308 RepID=A0A369I4M3_9BACT|nr:hypothetical protein [Runella aurantiaca]RDB03840.1 hypothetical protein DVG78_21540 [Runella aurantiaca]
MRAKTYRSTNGWTAPQSLSTFGIPVTNGKKTKYLGLEEFNFTEIYKKHKLAFIPAFSIERDAVIPIVKLFYSVPGATFHYATLENVRQIPQNPLIIQAIRDNQLADMVDFVENNAAFKQNYGILFNPAVDIWNNCFASNVIIADGVDTRFVVNVYYEKLYSIQPHNNVEWTNLKRVRSLYPDT